MGKLSYWAHIKGFCRHVPIVLAYRLVWMCAKLGFPSGIGVYKIMWKGGCNLPRIPGLNESDTE